MTDRRLLPCRRHRRIAECSFAYRPSLYHNAFVSTGKERAPTHTEGRLWKCPPSEGDRVKAGGSLLRILTVQHFIGNTNMYELEGGCRVPIGANARCTADGMLEMETLYIV